MNQRVVIIITVLVILAILIFLNAATILQASSNPETELAPNRSTYNAGPTGTRAFFDLLNESGYKVIRWREDFDRLAGANAARIGTMVVVGPTITPFKDEEAKNLLRWVQLGGTLVLIDRHPDPRLLPQSGSWTITTQALLSPFGDIDPANADTMTDGTTVLRASQPTGLTRRVAGVRPSRFAANVQFWLAERKVVTTTTTAKAAATEGHSEPDLSPDEGTSDDDDEEQPPPPAESGVLTIEERNAPARSQAPVVHLSDRRGALLVDFFHGAGRIIVLGDPYFVSNGGINLEDNLQLGINLVNAGRGPIGFDEYHQGHATGRD